MRPSCKPRICLLRKCRRLPSCLRCNSSNWAVQCLWVGVCALTSLCKSTAMHCAEASATRAHCSADTCPAWLNSEHATSAVELSIKQRGGHTLAQLADRALQGIRRDWIPGLIDKLNNVGLPYLNFC